MAASSPIHSWSKLVIGAILTGFCAMSVHLIMLEWLHVPYPVGYPESGLLLFLTEAILTLSVVHFWWLVSNRLSAFSKMARCAVLFLLLVMLREQLIRRPMMESVVTTAWTHSFVANIPMLVPFLVLACLVVFFAPWLSAPWQRPVGSLLIALIAFVAARPVFACAFQPLLVTIAALEHGEVCTHGPCVEIPGYLTYAEPVLAAFVVVALVWDRLSARLALRLVQFVLLLMLMDLSFLRPLVYGVAGPIGFWPGMLSMGQFWLEHLVLAFGTAATWMWFGERRMPVHPQTLRMGRSPV